MNTQNTKTPKNTTKKPIVTGKTGFAFSLLALALSWNPPLAFAMFIIGLLISLLALKLDPAGRTYAMGGVMVAVGLAIAWLLIRWHTMKEWTQG